MDNQEDRTCRYCLEPGPGLVSPCNCAGSLKYVHTSCLETWRATNPEYRDKCRECDAPYRWQQSHYAETFLLFVKVPLWQQYCMGMVMSLIFGVWISIADTNAKTALWVDTTWNTNFTQTLAEDAGMRAIYSVTLAGDLLYSLLWLILLVTLSVTLNNPCCYVKQCYKQYMLVVLVSQSHYVALLLFGWSPGLAVPIASVLLIGIPLAFNRYFAFHNNYIILNSPPPDVSFASITV